MDKSMIFSQVVEWVFPFGKHRGEKIVDVWQVDKAYCEWLYDTLDYHNETRKALKLLCPGVGESKEEDSTDTAKILYLQRGNKK